MLTTVLVKDISIWPAVYEDAQIQLRDRFGMELVELRSAVHGDAVPAVRILNHVFLVGVHTGESS